jgi:hypothetical protein
MLRFAIALVCGLTFLSPVAAQAPPTRDIDLVLCLDVSGSMDPLIEAARQKLWDLVNTLARARPMPNLRVALYSYGSNAYPAQAGWVRKEFDFGTDLDQVFQKLNELKTPRTGPSNEYVARVCRDALRDLKWSAQADALKVLFVCGNEPATQDPTLKLADIAAQAVKQGVVINPIYCGSANDPDAQGWREFAGLAKGSFANIDHTQPVAIATPQDQKLAELSDALHTTYVPYGAAGGARLRFQMQQNEKSAELGRANLAARAIVQAGAFYDQAGWDLVDKVKRDKNFDVTKLKTDELPEAMKKLTPEGRVLYVREMEQKRATLQKQVEELAKQRDEFLRQETQRSTAAGQRRFDAVLGQMIRRQAAEKKIQIPE